MLGAPAGITSITIVSRIATILPSFLLTRLAKKAICMPLSLITHSLVAVMPLRFSKSRHDYHNMSSQFAKR